MTYYHTHSLDSWSTLAKTGKTHHPYEIKRMLDYRASVMLYVHRCLQTAELALKYLQSTGLVAMSRCTAYFTPSEMRRHVDSQGF